MINQALQTPEVQRTVEHGKSVAGEKIQKRPLDSRLRAIADRFRAAGKTFCTSFEGFPPADVLFPRSETLPELGTESNSVQKAVANPSSWLTARHAK